MIVKDVIKLTATLLQLNNFISGGYFDEGETVTEEDELTATLLTNCFNIVNNTIATEYVPLIEEKECIVNDGKVAYSDLSDKTIMNIKSVKRLNGTPSRFSCFPTYIKVDESKVNISFAYFPPSLSEQSTVNTFGIHISEQIYAYGMASEYCVVTGMYDDAAIWDNKFKNALQGVVKKLGNIKLKERSWL